MNTKLNQIIQCIELNEKIKKQEPVSMCDSTVSLVHFKNKKDFMDTVEDEKLTDSIIKTHVAFNIYSYRVVTPEGTVLYYCS